MKDAEPQLSLNTENSLIWALCFEVGLGLAALFIGAVVTETWPAEHLDWPPPWQPVVVGFASALPMLAVMIGIRHLHWRPLQELAEFVDEKLVPMFRGLRIGELALLSLAAGWGEELLFRGLVQAEVARHSHPVAGVLVASFIFALVHFITPAYFAVAFLIGCYLGWLYWLCDSLWVPILGHAAYDFLMLIYILREDARGDEDAVGDA